jgi:hypothetical protein
MSTTIAGFPVLVDRSGEAQAWLNSYLPSSDIFRRQFQSCDTYLSGPRGSGEFFESNLPDLPPIEIGQIQWPCVGVSRFARGLFLVDRCGLFDILQEAWGIGVPTEYPYPIPATWPQARNRTVAVTLASGVVVHMFVLLPIRVSDDVWILPLVDGRYYGLGQPVKITAINPEKPLATWAQYFTALSAFNYNVTYAVESGISYGRPDPILRDPQVSLAYAIDAACFSVGCRPVVPFPAVADQTQAAFVQVVRCELPATAIAKKTTLLGLDKVTGGVSGAATKPFGIRFATRLVNSFYSGENRSYTYDQTIGSGAGEGVILFTKCLWNVHEPDALYTEFQEYSGAIADKIDYWNVDEYYVTFPDLVAIEPSGFDDYIVFDTLRKTTTVRSLPVDFIAPYHVSQAPAGDESDEAPTLWFHTQNQTVQATLVSPIAIGGVTSGFRNEVTGTAQIVDFSLTIPSGVPGTPPALSEARVTVVNGEARTLSAGTIVHLAWMDLVLWRAGYPYGEAVAYEGWVIDWADCA